MTTEQNSSVSAPVVVGSRVGLHARPAALVAQAVARLGATVTISKDDKGPVAASSPLMLMSLGARCGDEVVVHAEGPGAEDALQEILELIAQDLDAEDTGGQ